MSRSRQTFIQGAVILMAAGIFNRLIGFVPRIMLPRLIGAEGVGLFQMGYPLMSVLLTLITGGITLAVAKLVAEAETQGNYWRSRGILRTALLISGGLGAVMTLLCAAAARYLTQYLFTDQRVYWTIVCMSPIIFLVSLSSVLRGYFQGKHNMIPTAVSQSAETIVRCAMVLVIAWAFVPMGIAYAAAGAMIGVVCGELVGLALLGWHYVRYGRNRTFVRRAAVGEADTVRGRLRLARRLLRISVPVTASRLIGSASYFAESVLIVQSLAIAGVAAAAATAQYGMLQGMVMPLLLLPTALTYSLSVSLVPSLSEAAALRDMLTIRKRMHQSLRLTLVTGAPFAVILYVLAEPVCKLLYGSADIAPMLALMAPAAIFIYLQAPLAAALQALDKPGTALRNTLIGAIVKLVLIYALATNPELGINGAVLAICVNIALVTVLHSVSVARLLKTVLPPLDYVKVASGAIIMAAMCKFGYTAAVAHGVLAGLAAACAAGGLCYMLTMAVTGMIDRHDVVRLLRLRRH